MIDREPASLRIALLLETDGPGGAEMMLLQLGAELRRRGHDVLPVGPENGCGWLGDRWREQGFSPATFSLRHPLDRRCLRDLARLLAAHRTSVVHSHEFTMAVYGAAAARRIGASHIITMHGGRYYAERWRRRAALRWAIRQSQALVAVSGATANDIRRTLGPQAEVVRVIPNGITFPSGERGAVRRELGLTDDQLLLVAVGNLYAVKGHDVLLRALGELRRGSSHAQWRLAIAGRGEEESALRSLARAEGVHEQIHFLGFRSDVPDILTAADLFVMPSRSEGLPLALVEAMSMGLPIIASDVGGIPEVVTRDVEAVLVPPGNAHVLGIALRSLLEDHARRLTLGAAAATRARREFSVTRMTDAYEGLYRRSVDRQTPVAVPAAAVTNAS